MLNEDGFTRPTYNQLVEAYTKKWLQYFGENANTATNSVGGIFIRILAFFMNQLYQLAEQDYQSQFIDSATGTTLDQLAANLGLIRQAPETAIGTVEIYGVAGYVVPSGTLFETADGLNYVTSEDITLTDMNTTSLDLSADGLGKFTYNGENIGHGVSEVLYANGQGSIYNKPGVIKDYVANQVTPVEEVFVVRVGLITSGSDLETDDVLRERLEQASQEAPSSPYNGVISALLNVISVTAVRIVANDTMAVDATGNPAKTLHIYVDGGYKDDIGTAIFESIAAGIQTTGTIEVPVKDLGGTTHHVYYDQPTAVPVYVSVDATTNDEFGSNGKAEIQNAVVSYIKSLGMGATIYYSYLYKYIYDNVDGITVADVKIGTDKAKLSAANIVLTDIQRATISTDSVVIS